MKHILDNPVWNALNTGNKNLGEGTGKVKFYRSDISPFVGLEDNTHENLLALYELTAGSNDVFVLESARELKIQKPWTVVNNLPLFQMVYMNPKIVKKTDIEIINLSDVHIPQMMELATLTKPGPFRKRTIDFGHYQGIFHDGKLVAMAGQRMHPGSYAEISAVCTHPDFTGRGYAAQLMGNQIKRITDANEVPFLHVAADNNRAVGIYEALGFTKRIAPFVYVIKR